MKIINKLNIKYLFRLLVLLNFNLLYSDSSLNDPFSFNIKNKLKTLNVSSDSSVLNSNQDGLSVLAISKFKKNAGQYNFGAIIKKLETSETVFVGEFVWGYKVFDITEDKVILIKDGKAIILKLKT